jgi:hypothetical protein
MTRRLTTLAFVAITFGGSAALAQNITVTGCLYRPEDVPALSPREAPRVSAPDRYVLVKAPALPNAPVPEANQPPGTVSGANMFQLSVLPSAQLKALIGTRVEVTGRLMQKPDDGTLPEIGTAMIKAIEGVCPVAPAPAGP